ncbi:MAG TPA: type II toxin-antitoxin system Phd/YefM family antitoxin [Chthoniobacterales bacterium]|jgi:prevent-host-death family protein
MKASESSRLTDGTPVESLSVRDIGLMPGAGEAVSVRAAKAHLSSLLDLVEQGGEVVITSNGKPKARLVSAASASRRQPLAFSPGYIAPAWRGGATADEMIREDRDGRGW